MIITGAGPVEGGDEHTAAANMNIFVEQVRRRTADDGEVRGYTPEVGEPVRAADLDADGRFGWRLQVNGAEQVILMPGVDVALLRGPDVDVPCLRVNGDPAWWRDSVGLAVPLVRGTWRFRE